MNTQVSSERCSNCKWWDYANDTPAAYSECKRTGEINRKFTDAGYKCKYFEDKEKRRYN